MTTAMVSYKDTSDVENVCSYFKYEVEEMYTRLYTLSDIARKLESVDEYAELDDCIVGIEQALEDLERNASNFKYFYQEIEREQ